MALDFILHAEPRSERGTNANRRLRRTGRVPAVVYGAGKDPSTVALEHRELLRYQQEEAFFSHILNLQVGEQSEQVILRDLQRHPSKPYILHADLLRVSATEKLRTTIPVHFVGEEQAPGIKHKAGVAQHLLTEVEVECLPGNLPEFITADVSELDIGDSLHLTDLVMPAGVALLALSHAEDLDEEELAAVNATVVSIQPPAKAEAGEEGEEAGEEGVA